MEVTDDEGADRPTAEGEPAAETTTPAETAPTVELRRTGGGLRLLTAAVTVPWMLGHGVTGAWAGAGAHAPWPRDSLTSMPATRAWSLPPD